MSNVNKSDPKEKKTLVQVQVRLEPQELADLKACADTECRTMASVLRLITLRGLAEYRRDPLTLSPTYRPATE
jgi:hypothetical protein